MSDGLSRVAHPLHAAPSCSPSTARRISSWPSLSARRASREAQMQVDPGNRSVPDWPTPLAWSPWPTARSSPRWCLAPVRRARSSCSSRPTMGRPGTWRAASCTTCPLTWRHSLPSRGPATSFLQPGACSSWRVRFSSQSMAAHTGDVKCLCEVSRWPSSDCPLPIRCCSVRFHCCIGRRTVDGAGHRCPAREERRPAGLGAARGPRRSHRLRGGRAGSLSKQ